MQFPATPDVQGLKFTGKERDAETGLDYFSLPAYLKGRYRAPWPQ